MGKPGHLVRALFTPPFYGAKRRVRAGQQAINASECSILPVTARRSHRGSSSACVTLAGIGSTCGDLLGHGTGGRSILELMWNTDAPVSLLSHGRFAQPDRELSVMIVEDESLIALSLEDAFQDEGYRVSGIFSSSADAVAALVRASPDLAILDASLKDGSCLQLARELQRRNIPFLIYSGRNAVEEHAPELGGVPWIDKPSPPELVLRGAVTMMRGGASDARV